MYQIFKYNNIWRTHHWWNEYWGPTKTKYNRAFIYIWKSDFQEREYKKKCHGGKNENNLDVIWKWEYENMKVAYENMPKSISSMCSGRNLQFHLSWLFSYKEKNKQKEENKLLIGIVCWIIHLLHLLIN